MIAPMAEPAASRPGPRLPAPLLAVAATFHNVALRRILAAYVGFSLAEWSSWIAILVYAYTQGGATETGVVALIQLAPSAAIAPVAASLGDRVRRDRALRFAYAAQAVSMGATAVALLGGAPNWVVYLFAAAAAASVTLTRPVQAAILPALARTPSELTAANVAAGTVETASILIGPVLAGVALAVSNAGAVFAASAGVTFIGALLVNGVRAPAGEYAGDLHPEATVSPGGLRGAIADTLAGFGMLAREERPRSVVALLGAASVLWGALDVFLVVLAIDLLDMGDAGVGFLNAALGAGGLLGAALSVALIGRTRLALPFVLGIALWAIPLSGLGLLPLPLAAFALLAVAGLGRVIMDVAGRTLLQRVAPERMLARVFGVLEGIDMAALAIGSILAPLLIGLLGAQGALVAAGLALLLATGASWRPLRRADAMGIARPREIAILRGIPMFAPLPPPAIERLASQLVPVTAPPGTDVVRQGEHGDRFFIIRQGRVRVAVDGRVVREEGPGESFGEIALLRNVPRTATVSALEPLELLALDRRPFLEAVTGQPASTLAAEGVVEARLGTGGRTDAGA